MDLVLPKDPGVKGKEFLLLGFANSFEDCLQANLPQGNEEKFWELNNSFAAFNWLKNLARRSHHKLPKCIFINAKAQRQENFLFVHSIRKDEVLSKIPLIAIGKGENDLGLKHAEALKIGIDDYYVCPPSWEMLQIRINFLTQHKSRRIQTEPTPNFSILGKSTGWKRIFDIVASTAIIICISPILLLIAFLIKLESKGPIIYKSKRVGVGYQIFDFLKFRSMYADADKRIAELMHLNKYDKNGSANSAFVKFENDPRITKMGKFIRKTSLDELPQLFNVLRGEMSIVGNRPLPLYEAEQLTKDEWAGRFLAPAGITGLWQVSKKGKDNMSVEERLGLDNQYARKYNLFMDFGILLRTLPAMIQKGE